MVEAVKIFSMKIEHVMKHEAKFHFPEFMRIIRRAISLSRKFVCESLNCSQTKILFIERGVYGRRGPEIEFVLALAEFYGLDINFTIKKYRDFMKSPDRPAFEKAQKDKEKKRKKDDTFAQTHNSESNFEGGMADNRGKNEVLSV